MESRHSHAPIFPKKNGDQLVTTMEPDFPGETLRFKKSNISPMCMHLIDFMYLSVQRRRIDNTLIKLTNSWSYSFSTFLQSQAR